MSPIKITLNQIKSHSPCESGWNKLLAAQGKTKADDVPFQMSNILDSNGLDDCIWAMRCLPEHNNLWRKYAVWCARQVEHLMKDERSLNALDVAWRHSEGQATDEELNEARAAAYDARANAYDAAYAAAHAAYAACDAYDARANAYDAAYAAAHAAYAACDACAAYDAACGAAHAAAHAAYAADAAMEKQADKLREILNAGQLVGGQK